MKAVVVKAVNGNSVSTTDELLYEVKNGGGKSISVEVEREGTTVALTIEVA